MARCYAAHSDFFGKLYVTRNHPLGKQSVLVHVVPNLSCRRSVDNKDPLKKGFDADHRGDFATAAAEFKPLAEHGDVRAQVMLGIYYGKGSGVTKDSAASAMWFRTAAAQGDAGGQYEVGMIYYLGTGVAKDDAQAASWFRKSAAQGNEPSQYMLGSMYEDGNGVPVDLAQATEWYRKAATQGSTIAMENLGQFYASGKGVRQDIVAAYALYLLAVEKPIPGNIDKQQQGLDEKEWKRLMAQMTREQISDGDALNNEMQQVGVIKALDAHK